MSAEERRIGVTDEYHDRLAPERMPFAYRASDVFVGRARASRRASACPRSRRWPAACRRCSRTFPGSARSAGTPRGTSGDGDPESLAAALPALLTEEARARARAARPGGGGALRHGRGRRAARERLPDRPRERRVTPSVSVVVVNHRSAAEAAACVASAPRGLRPRGRSRARSSSSIADRGPRRRPGARGARRRRRGVPSREPRLLRGRQRRDRERPRAGAWSSPTPTSCFFRAR